MVMVFVSNGFVLLHGPPGVVHGQVRLWLIKEVKTVQRLYSFV